MSHRLSRRHLLAVPVPLGAAAMLGIPSPVAAYDEQTEPYPGFPAQQRPRVREMVLKAHSDLEAVEKLLGQSPALANAAIDWGFGDWESAIGAAGHMGRRDIAKVLLEEGARPDIFTHTMLGHLAVVRAAVEAAPGLQSILGPHGITMMSHARAGGDQAKPVVDYLEKLGGADPVLESKATSVPLSTYTGSYRHGTTSEFSIEERRERLFFLQGEDFPRALFHAGNHEFHPSSPSVRLRFHLQEGQVTQIDVFDHELQVKASKASPSTG